MSNKLLKLRAVSRLRILRNGGRFTLLMRLGAPGPEPLGCKSWGSGLPYINNLYSLMLKGMRGFLIAVPYIRKGAMRGQRTATAVRPFGCALGKRASASGGLAGTFGCLAAAKMGACGELSGADVRANTVLPVFCTAKWKYSWRDWLVVTVGEESRPSALESRGAT